MLPLINERTRQERVEGFADGKISRSGCADHVRIPCSIHGNSVPGLTVAIRSGEPRGVRKGRAGGVDLGYERPARATWLESARRGGKIGREGVACDVGAAGRVDRDSAAAFSTLVSHAANVG